MKAEYAFAMVFLFKQLSFNFGLAAALFYLAELVEEYTVIAAKVIKCTIAVSIIKLIHLSTLNKLFQPVLATGLPMLQLIFVFPLFYIHEHSLSYPRTMEK